MTQKLTCYRPCIMAMLHRIVFSSMFVLAVMPEAASSSEALVDMGAFMCEPMRVTRTFMQRCLDESPALKRKYPNLQLNWERKNQSAAVVLEADCKALALKTSNAAERTEYWLWVEATNDRSIKSKLASAAKKPSGCDEDLAAIANGEADLEKLIQPAK